MELFDLVFSNFLFKGVARKNILDLMEQFGLIAKFSSLKTGEKYFVPSQLKASPDSLCSMAPSRLDPCPLFVYFVSGSVPHGLFTRLVSRSVRWCSEAGPTQPPTLYQNGAWFVIEKKTVHDFVLILRGSLLTSLSSKETTLSRSLSMRQVRWQCRFVSLWRQLCKLCHVISIKVDCSIVFGSPVRIVSGKNAQAIIRLHVLMKIVFTSLSYDKAFL